MDNYEERSRRGHKYYSINRNSRLQENELKELKEIGGKKVLKILLANSSNPLLDIESLENSLSPLYSDFNRRTVYSYSLEEEKSLLNLYYGYLQ